MLSHSLNLLSKYCKLDFEKNCMKFWNSLTLFRNLLVDWIYGLVFSLTPDVLPHILDKPETVEMRTALLDSFLRHSLPKKTLLDNKIFSNSETVGAHWSAGISFIVACYFKYDFSFGRLETTE